MKNVLKTIGVLSLAILLFAGCEKKINNSDKNATSASRGNCTLFECMGQIEATNTIAQINDVIGFEAKIKEESGADATSKWILYSWELTDNTSIEARHYENSDTVYLEAIYPRDLIKNEKVDLSQANDMKSKINQEGGLMYDEVKSMLGNVDGVLVKKDSYSNTYIWANTTGGSITAHFNKDGKCTLFTGIIK